MDNWNRNRCTDRIIDFPSTVASEVAAILEVQNTGRMAALPPLRDSGGRNQNGKNG
jgi:hypothetical protein